MLIQLFWLILGLSLLAFGGGSAIIPDLQRELVEQRGWVTARQFVDFYALTQVTPGPAMLVVCMIGFHLSGVLGAVVAFVAMFGPSTLLLLAVKPIWSRLRESHYQVMFRRATRPLAVATILASSSLVAWKNNHGALQWGLSVFAMVAVASGRVGILPTMVVCAGVSLMAGG